MDSDNDFSDLYLEKDIISGKGYLWIFQALLSAVLFGLSNSIYSTITRHGLYSTAFLGPSGILLVFADYYVFLKR